MSIKSALIISGAILAAALGIYWIAAPREACPEELYRQYMQLSPFEQFDQKEKLLKKAAQAGCIPAMRQMADRSATIFPTANGPSEAGTTCRKT